MNEEKLDLSIEDIEIGDPENPMDRLRRNAPVMADFTQAYQEEMKNPPFLIAAAWTPPKVENKVAQFKIGTVAFESQVEAFLSEDWDIWQTYGHNEWFVIIFIRKVDTLPKTD